MFSSELLVIIFQLIIDDIFDKNKIEQIFDDYSENSSYEIAQIRVNSEITPIKTINNIRITCKDFNNIFTILFKKSFIDYFDIKINLDSTKLWKELIENSVKEDIMNNINEYYLQLRMEHSEYSYLKSTTPQNNDISFSEFFTFLGCYMKYNQLRSIVLIPTYDYITGDVFYDYNCIECDGYASFKSVIFLKNVLTVKIIVDVIV
ncbi:6166_t:CDS:1, partial [Scutellospora calospora]